ncbi:hypothetical protein HON36_03395 [Candidatus Parcubacteria bacterium]|jgi:hypothetical protein|nr:hypothetical protein [Candidatus Parcubacteria bacterium]
MEYKLVVNKPKSDPGSSDIIISITDIKFHTTNKREGSIGKTIKKAVETNKPGRVYSNIEKRQDNKPILDLILQDSDLLEVIKGYNEQGKRVFIEIPKEVPVLAGKDTDEFINSKKGKRIIRKIAKDKK